MEDEAGCPNIMPKIWRLNILVGRYRGIYRSERRFSDVNDPNVDFDDYSRTSRRSGHAGGKHRGVRHSEGHFSEFEGLDDEFYDYARGGRRVGGRYHGNTLDGSEEQAFRRRGGRPGGTFSESRVHEFSHEPDDLREPIRRGRGPPHSPGAASFGRNHDRLRHARGAVFRRVSPSPPTAFLMSRRRRSQTPESFWLSEL